MSLALQTQCCCGGCPTKEESGLPDTLSAAFRVLSSSDAGMPADSVIGSCDANQIHLRFSHSSALVDLLDSIEFSYVELATSSTCGVCCFRYEGVGDYTPECPADHPGGAILFGGNPFRARAIGGRVFVGEYEEAATLGHSCAGDCPDIVTIGNPPSQCCTNTCDTGYCCPSLEGFSSTGFRPQPVHGGAELLICVAGNVVTVCTSISMVVPCQTYSGHFFHGGPCKCHSTVQLGFDCNCGDVIDDWSADGSIGCANSGATIYLTATADLSGVAGATLWEKIKNATWTSGFEVSVCHCSGGGCVGDYQHSLVSWALGNDCGCIHCDGVQTVATQLPIDQECLYAIGEMSILFSG